MSSRQTRLNRWGARATPPRPTGEQRTCRLVSKFDDNRFIYVMLDDDNMVCIEVPQPFRQELEGKHEQVMICQHENEWRYHSTIKEE